MKPGAFDERSAARSTPHSIEQLRRDRPRSRLVRISMVLLLALVAYAWLSGDIAFDDMFTARRAENLERFLAVDARPFELRNEPFSFAHQVAWA